MTKPDIVARENYKESMEKSYCISKRFGSMTFQEAIDSSKEAFVDSGFEMVMHFDLQDHIKKSINKEIKRYYILGMCNASLAMEALSVENKVGIMLPCNILIQETHEEGIIEIAVTDPLAALEVASNDKLKAVGKKAKEQIQRALNKIKSQNSRL